MTPSILEYGHMDPYVYELSRGEFMGNPLYGVTVASTEDTHIELNLSTSFNTFSAAKAYIDSKFNPNLKEA